MTTSPAFTKIYHDGLNGWRRTTEAPSGTINGTGEESTVTRTRSARRWAAKR